MAQDVTTGVDSVDVCGAGKESSEVTSGGAPSRRAVAKGPGRSDARSTSPIRDKNVVSKVRCLLSACAYANVFRHGGLEVLRGELVFAEGFAHSKWYIRRKHSNDLSLRCTIVKTTQVSLRHESPSSRTGGGHGSQKIKVSSQYGDDPEDEFARAGMGERKTIEGKVSLDIVDGRPRSPTRPLSPVR